MSIPQTHIELRFQPTVDLVSTTRKFVCAYYEHLLQNADLLSRIGLATHELLENIVKYSADGETTTRVTLACDKGGRKVTIETTNRVAPEARAALEAIFSEMQSATDAFDFYQCVMRKAQHREEGSGLGLARIWAEGEMTISHRFDNDFVTITAVATLANEATS